MARTNQRHIPLALFLIALALLGGRIVMGMMPKPAEKQGLVRWMTPQEGVLLARQTHKPMLLDFTADWCGPCHLLDEQVFRDAAIARDINARFIAIRVTDRKHEEGSNPQDVEALQRKYNVRGFPTVVIADANLEELARMEGFRGRDEFERVMERVR